MKTLEIVDISIILSNLISIKIKHLYTHYHLSTKIEET